MGSGDVTARLDLAARTIDLSSTIARCPASDLVRFVVQESAKAGIEIIEWLARERIPKDAFCNTMCLAENLAQPNRYGLEIVRGMNKASDVLFNMKLIMPGAIGRHIVYDKPLRWLATTEATLLKYHDSKYAVEAFSALFTQISAKGNSSRTTIIRDRIQPVIFKVVDSIHLHTVNMGCEVRPLPPFLAALKMHKISPKAFAEAIMALTKSPGDSLVLEMDRFLVELVDWALNHWDGQLLVAIDNRIGFSERLGDEDRVLAVMISKKGTKEAMGDEHDLISFRIARFIDQNTFPPQPSEPGFTHKGFNDPRLQQNDHPAYRSALYDIKNPLETLNCTLNSTERKRAETQAQIIVRSIVELPVRPAAEELAFQIDAKSLTPYRWWLKKFPTILQKNLQKTKEEPRILYEAGNDSAPRHVAFSYPEIMTGLELAFERCQCGCNKSPLKKTLGTKLDSGCLLSVMFLEMMLHVAHAMAEAAGAQDISNLRGARTAIELGDAADKFLSIIATSGVIRWATWFRLVASAITGLPHNFAEEADEPITGYNGITNKRELLLWVAGGITVAPCWLGYDSELALQGSWGVRQATGYVVEGISAEKAVIQASASMESADTPQLVYDLPSVVTASGGQDLTDVEIRLAFFPVTSTGEVLQLTALLKTPSALRTFDPSQIYQAARLAERPECTHSRAEEATFSEMAFRRGGLTLEQLFQGRQRVRTSGFVG
ncbi:hypothetical protein CEP52_017084 [Fusarium oligoseptatum]|uniref:Uncharacterized protein n=1 Tax=Fusarium oligoseptatum TaxID=2604345 RepID=A0A428RWP6_9HYPO|nr:hypothetical protein CEP52_017084 [Fusarium oligoseptatum]